MSSSSTHSRRKLWFRQGFCLGRTAPAPLIPGRFTVDVSMETERFDKSIVLQHHTFFAVTRWTNFYFERDPVGGALLPILGSGIDDRRLSGPDLLRAPVSYWSLDEKGESTCVDAVRAILTEPVGQPQ